MSETPHEVLRRRCAEGDAPEGVHVSAYAQALTLYRTWADKAGRPFACPTPADGETFLAYLRSKAAAPRTAFARFANFQVSAGLVWGAAETAHLAATLRAARVTRKAVRTTPMDRALSAIAVLPEAWRTPLAATLAAPEASARDLRRQTVVWSADRVTSVAQALRRYGGFCATIGAEPAPAGATFMAWAEDLQRRTDEGSEPPGETAIHAYLERVLHAFEVVLTPGLVYDGAALVVAEWGIRAEKGLKRKNKQSRIVPASTIFGLGLDMMIEAEASQVRRISEATLYRDGLLLAMSAALPERARAHSVLEFDRTVFLEAPDILRLEIPGSALKLREARKRLAKVRITVENHRLHRALSIWRTQFRPVFDEGLWLYPSRLDRSQGMAEAVLGDRFTKITKKRLARAISLHMVRDCVATEIIDVDLEHGPMRACGVLRHTDLRTTTSYDQSEGRLAAAGWQEAIAARGLPQVDLAFD